MLRYDTVLWDLDGTLLDFKMSERYALGVCLESFGATMTEEMLALYSGINEAYWQRLERGEVEKKELLPGRFRDFFRQTKLTHIDPEEMQRRYERELGVKTYYVDDSYEIVKKLKAMGLKQYIVTNGIVVTQQIKMKNSGFDKLIDKVFISDVIGYEKPRKEFFDVVFEEISDFDRERALLIGDSLTSDMRGANNAGVDACWYNPEGKSLPERERGEEALRIAYEIRDLRDVFGVIKE